MRFNSIRFKTNILYTVILGVILFIYSGVLFHAVRVILYRGLDESLKDEIKGKQIRMRLGAGGVMSDIPVNRLCHLRGI